jgi:hypothetical protein
VVARKLSQQAAASVRKCALKTLLTGDEIMAIDDHVHGSNVSAIPKNSQGATFSAEFL